MKRILYNRLVALLLTICVSISLFTARAHSDDRIDDGGTASSYGEASLAEPAESFETAEQKQLPDLEDLLKQGVEITDLKYLDREAIEDGGAVRRLIDKETLNTYAFLNRDGTESVVMFPHNIKYIDESGAAVEKDLTLVEAKAGGYTVKSNDYDVLFSENVKDGMSFAYSGGTIRLTPESAGGKLVKEENSIAYPGVFGENTILRYTPLLNGVKEDIVLEEYTGVSSFKFKLAVDKLLLSDKEGRIEFIDENGEPVIEFSDVIAYDSSGMVVNGTLLVEKTTEGTDYSVTVSVPEKFLTDPKTVYPVTIDPTISTDPRNCAIQDAPIYESKNDMNFGARLYNDIGNATYGKSRTAVWLSGLETHPIYRTLDAEEIVSVVLSVRETTGTSGLFVNLYRITDFVLWTESTVTWDNVGSHSEDINAGGMLNQSSRAYFDITNWAKGWQNCSYTRTMRVIFTMSGGETSAHKQFDSAQCSDITRQPYVTFTYQLKNLMNEGTYYIRNKHIDRFVQPTGGSTSANAKLELNAFTGNDIQKWIVTSRGNGFYTIKNVQTNYVLSVPSGSYSTYDVQLTQASNTNADGQQWRIYMTSYCGFAIKPKSSCGPGDGQNWSDHTMSVADGNDGNGALVTQRPYVYNNSFKDEWYLIPTNIETTSEYNIINRELGTYIQLEGSIGSSNCQLALYNQSGMTAQKWRFTSVGGGYYKISPYAYPTYAISIASGNENTENAIIRVQTYNANNSRQHWFVYKVPNGYVFKARSSGINNLVLSVNEGNLGNGAVVSQRPYVSNLSYKEEWKGFTPASSNTENNKTYFVRNKATGLYLTQVSIMAGVSSYSGEANQKWQLQSFHDGSVRLVNLSENTPSNGDNRYVLYASTAISVNVLSGVASTVPLLNQGWIIGGSYNNATIRSQKFPDRYLRGSSTYANLSLTVDNYSRWELIECSNPYVLPSISNGKFKTDKYSSGGSEGLKNRMNCYSYALGFYGRYAESYESDHYGDVQPGSLSGNSVSIDYSQFSYEPSLGIYQLSPLGIDRLVSSIISALNSDLQVLFDDTSVRVCSSTSDEVMTGPWKKVALVLDTAAAHYNPVSGVFADWDYHWYVEHSDGKWSHKRGLSEAELIDASELSIGDPQFCNRYYNSLANYDYFVGYYKIKMDSVPDDIVAFEAFENYDSAGDVSSMALNIGLVHHGSNYVYDTRQAKIEYSSSTSDYPADAYLGAVPVVNTFDWPADADWFEFMVETSGSYSIFSGGNSIDTYGVLLRGDQIIAEDDDSGAGHNFLISAYLVAGQLYKICVAPSYASAEPFEYWLSFD